jgi:hypothetical protein
MADLGKKQGVFVAAHPGHGVALTQVFLESVRYSLQEPVADVVAKRVVDGLETIKIQKEDGELMVAPMRLGYGHGKTIIEEYSVGKTRKGVVVSLEPDRFLHHLIGRDVPDDAVVSFKLAV